MSTPATPQPPIIQMVQDPDFGKMAVAEQRKALAAHDPIFQNAGDDVIGQFVQAHQAAQPPNAGLAPPAGPDTSMQTSALGSLYRGAANTAGFVKGFGSETAKQTFGGGNLGEGGQLPAATDEQIRQHQPLSYYLNQASPSNFIDNIGGGLKDTGSAIAQRASTPEGAGSTVADLAMLLRGGKKIAQEVLPSTEKAGQAFGQVKAAAGDIPIDMTAPGNTALEIQRLAQSGGQMPKVVRDFIKRATDPSQGPITYAEARDFYSNASRLSADEAQRLTPNMKRMAGQFRSDLGQSIQGAAAQAGQGEKYVGAMQQYRQAMQLQDFIDMLKGSAVNAIKYGVPTAVGGAAAGYVAKKALGAK